MAKVSALIIRLDSNRTVKIYIDGLYSCIDWKTTLPTILDNVFSCSTVSGKESVDSGISVDKGLDGNGIIRITETKRYRLRVESTDEFQKELPKIPNEGKFLKCSRDENSMSFQYINYLGRSRFTFSNPFNEIVFEVTPDKIDYEKDYIELTEAIAQKCAALLLEHAGSTSMVFKHDDARSKTVLEQFIFLRQFCYSDNLISLFEAIKRNPDRMLETEEIFRPVGSGIPSKRFFTHPFSYGKDWTKYANDSLCRKVYLPQRVTVTRKFDSVDTPANRLIKFALESFDLICIRVLATASINASECVKEAENMHRMFDDILHDAFFSDVGELDIIPFNNQVLQKREGYSQIFAAFQMIDLALQLNWRGQSDVYEGESKNVALLYEYWLFFELYEIVKSIQGCEPVKTDENPFISEDNGLTLSLKESTKSCQSFELVEKGIRINLYYNRTFNPNEFKSTGYEGSYSRPFRPDYTLAVFPNYFQNERSAIIGGAVSFIHFDAKYRVDKLNDLIGSINTDSTEEALDIEKQEAITNTYKRGDLLKMHTYNDAIRRTVGSYVLFPGTINSERKTFKLYDELLPGVGAFAIKPSIRSQSENTIRQFILDLVNVRNNSASRLSRLSAYNEMIVREPGEKKTKTEDVSKDTKCILGYLRAQQPGDYYNFLVAGGKFKPGEKLLFYFYAIKDGNVYSHHKDVFNANYIRFYKNDIYIDNKYRLEPILCRVESNSLASKESLVNQLNNLGYQTTVEQHKADYYYVLNVTVDDAGVPPLELDIDLVNSINGNDTYSPHSPKVIVYKDYQ